MEDSKSLTALSTSADEEADQDLSSKIIEIRGKNETIIEKISITENEEKAEITEKVESVIEAVELLDPRTVDVTDNIVFRKLLRGPRYFSPPDSGWETCYNCGEEGHMAVNCKSASQRKKACFVCGSLDHGARQCSKAQDCFICKKGGHRAKDCPDKYKSGSKHGKICLRCGVSGHDMFSCRNEYSHEDIKEIQCYICERFGHLCCVNFVDAGVREISCYRCGCPGHNGLSCGRSRRETKETTYNELPSLCYKCGEGGHFARECIIGTASSSLCRKCGEGGHFARECTTGAASSSLCYKCGEGGHFARECTIGTSSSSLCHKCGEGGHFARECTTGTASSSLCYKCGEGGHFARECTIGTSSSSLCHKCGEGGHFARECTIGTASSSLCYKCGEGGHFARKCSSAKVGKRSRESYTPNVRPRRENKGFLGYKSAPQDNAKSRKRKRIQFEEKGSSTPRKQKKRGFSTPRKEKKRSGWITEDNRWNSPSTPFSQGRKKSSLTSGGRRSGSQSSKSKNSSRFSASRFGNFGNDEPRTTYNRW